MLKSATTDQEGLQPVTSEVINVLVRNRERFRAFLSRRLGNEAVADEILQQSLLKAVENERSLENKESVVPWFYKILRNSVIDHYRSCATDTKKKEDFLGELEATQANIEVPTDELGKAICQCFEGLLPTLKPAYSDLLRRIDLGGQTPESVANNLGISANNLQVRLHRARQALRKSLEHTCGACSEHGCLDCSCR
jgi:RNA polymerase sigma factor (sigma-70 family)